ncbi:hypothetical protein DIPPA_22517 [Diplonema papillatum]|nr:hypothetical protein DIPPA_22517 [Diplonema papillatum]
MNEQGWQIAGEVETLGEDILALEAHRVELDKARQNARRAHNDVRRKGAGKTFMLTDVGIFVATKNPDVLEGLKAEQDRMSRLLDENTAETKQKMARLAELEDNSEMKKWAASFNIVPMSREEASFDPNS